jgi:hypothetical protein
VVSRKVYRAKAHCGGLFISAQHINLTGKEILPMSDKHKQKNWFKKHTAILAIIALIIVIGLATSAVLLATSKHNSNSKKQVSSPTTTDNTAVASAYKLTACKSGATQTIANASYLVGTDIAPGSYKIVSQPASDGWTLFDIYNSKSDYDKTQDPNNKQQITSNSFQAYNSANDMSVTAAPTYTKLNDGQYMVISYDPATLTCE